MRENFKKIITEKSGASLVITAVFSSLLIMSVGAAIDIGRAQILESKLTSALDTTALAKVRDIPDGTYKEKTRPYFDYNFDGFMNAKIAFTDPEVKTTESPNDTLVLNASAEIPYTFMRIFGFDKVTVRAHSEAQITSSTMELVLALDNTGSMKGVNMSSLKNASSAFINQIYSSSLFQNNTFIGIVPFNTTVNIGRGNEHWTQGALLDWGTTDWDGCVEARDGGQDVTETPPTGARFPKYYWPCRESDNIYVDNVWIGASCESGGGYAAPLDEILGPNKECGNLQPITPLTRSSGTLLNAINNMEALGSTHVNMGLMWAWYMLSPQWRGVWGGNMNAHNLPRDYDEDISLKSIILMTDGANTIYHPDAYSGYGFLEDAKLGTSNQTGAVDEMNNRLSRLCQNIKDQNITVFTLALGADITDDTKNRLRTCATAPEFAFTVENTVTLNGTFQVIIERLAEDMVTVKLIK